ncbi:MAG: SDR family oxidoreductase [Rhodothermales bacterium]
MDLGLDGCVAFVAGASSGLGYAVARQLAAEGCAVAICSRDLGRISAAAASLARDSGVSEERVHGIACDVTDETAVRGAIGQAVETFGALNILITNAGGPPAGSIDDLSTEQWRSAIDLNLMSTIHLCRAALPHLRRAAKSSSSLARILMITSISAKQPIPNLYLSNATRAGVQGFAKSLSEELGPEGITVNTILPGYTRTARTMELARSAQAKSGKSLEEIEGGWADATALKRMATPEEFAAAAAFLVSAKASYVTGVGFPVDGGRSKHLL